MCVSCVCEFGGRRREEEEEEERGEEVGSAKPKTRTPHNDVGKKQNFCNFPGTTSEIMGKSSIFFLEHSYPTPNLLWITPLISPLKKIASRMYWCPVATTAAGLGDGDVETPMGKLKGNKH